VAKHDWPTIRKDYVEGIEQDGKLTWPTMEAIAVKYGIEGPMLRMHASKQKWTDLRDKYHTKQLHARQDARVKAVATGAAKFDAKILQAANGLADLLVRAIAKLEPEATGELRSTSASLVNVQRAGRIALGEPADGPPGPGGQLLGTVLIRVVRDGPYGETIEHNPNGPINGS